MRHTHKSVGFRLTGNPMTVCQLTNTLHLNREQVFDIQIFPHQPPTATLTHLKRNEIKSISIELPPELERLSYEKTYVFFVQNELKLVVSEEGYERLGNKKLVLKFSDSSHQCPVDVHILIQGNLENKNFRIHLHPFAIDQSHAEIQEVAGSDYLKLAFQFPELENEKSKTISRILHKLTPNNFNVERKLQSIFLTLGPSLSQFISNPNLLSRIKKEQTHEVEEENVYFMEDLSNESPQESPPYQSKEDFLKEIETLIHDIANSEYFHEFHISLESLPKSYLIDTEVLNLMIKILQNFLEWFNEENQQAQYEEKRTHSTLYNYWTKIRGEKPNSAQ